MSYKSLSGTHLREKIIEKSRFLTYTAHTAGEEDARAFLASVRAGHPLATHVCYAFIADSIGNLQRFSDDGEPQGTAGMPILNVIKAQGLFETTVAVVRYFGGIKLGAGGLVSAYSRSVSEALDNAKIVRCDRAKFYEVVCDYSDFRRLSDEAEKRAQITATEYGDKVTLSFTVTLENENALIEKLTDVSSGKAQITYTGEGFFGFDK